MSPHDRGASAQRVAARYKQKKKVKTKDGDESTVYVYSEGQLAHRHREKAKRIEGLRSCVGELRTQVHRDLTAKDPKKRLTALAVSLIDKTCERVGNEGSAEEGHYGVTGWLKKHLTFKGGTAVLRYVGKSGVKHVKEVDHAATVKALRDAAEGKGAEDPLFDDGEVCVRASDVNEYLKPFDVTAKDIRGFRANTEMLRALKAQRADGPGELPRDRAERDKILKGEFKAALEEVAEIVGHEASTLRSQYLVPALEDTFMGDGTVIKELDAKKTAAAPRVRPGARVHVPGYGVFWAEKVDSDDAFPPAVARYWEVDGVLLYEGRDGSRGVVGGGAAVLAQWKRDVDAQLQTYPLEQGRPEPYAEHLHGGAALARAAEKTARDVLRKLGATGRVELYARAGAEPSGEYGGGVLALTNVHLPGSVRYSMGVAVPVGLQVAAHEAAHAGYSRGGQGVLSALKAHRAAGGAALTTYHAIAGDFEGAMEAAALYELRPEALAQYSREVYGAVVEWFGDPPARLATKTPAEREDEAVRKNVRQSPKKKPPRKDLRKRRVEEADPDMDTSAEERDYSLNYKRVAARWVRAEGGFREYVESRRFKNPETGNEVSYDSLPEEAQVEIRDQWEGKNLPGDEAKEPEAPGSEDAPSSGGGGGEGAGVRAELRSLAQGGDSLRPETAREIGDLFERVVAVLTLEAGEELAQGVRKDMERVADRAARASGFAAQVQELLARGDGGSLPPPGEARAAYEKALARVSRMDPEDPKASSARDALIEAARDFYRTAVARDYITRPELGEPAPEGGDEQSLKAWAAARARDRYEALPAGYREERLAAVASELDQVRAELAQEGAGGVSSARLERKRAVLEADWEEGRIMSLLEEKKSPSSSEDGDGEPDPEVFASQLVRSLHGRVGRGDKHLRALVHGPEHPQYAAAIHNLTNLLSDAELKKFLGPEAGELLDAMSKGSEEDGGGPASREERQELRRALINGRVNDLGGTAPADPPPPARGGSEAEWRKRMKAWLAARMEALAERLAEPFEGPAPGDVTSIMRVASRALRSGAYRPW